MGRHAQTRRRRETIVFVALSVLCGAGALCYLVLMAETWVGCALAIVALLIILGAVNYIVWGSGTTAGRPDWRNLPPAIRERLTRNVVTSREDDEPPRFFECD